MRVKWESHTWSNLLGFFVLITYGYGAKRVNAPRLVRLHIVIDVKEERTAPKT